MNSREPILAVEQTINVGVPVVIHADSLDNMRGVVFEDDGETGYFYAVDMSGGEIVVVDALHIYSVGGVEDRHVPSKLCILWSFDHSHAALIINQYPHAVFDFVLKHGYCIGQFPEPSATSAWKRKPWDDSLRELFIK